MDNKTFDLARSAGFMYWDNEHWAPENQAIDWSCDYDEELMEFKKLVVRECAWVINNLVEQRVPASEYRDHLFKHWKMLN